MRPWSLIFILLLSGCGGKEAPVPGPESVPEQTAVDAEPEKEISVLLPEDKRMNPFLTIEEEKVFGEKAREVLKDMKLSAVFNSARGSYAVINGQVVAQDDTIAGKTVLMINKDSVVLKDATREYVVNIQGGR